MLSLYVAGSRLSIGVLPLYVAVSWPSIGVLSGRWCDGCWCEGGSEAMSGSQHVRPSSWCATVVWSEIAHTVVVPLVFLWTAVC